MCNIQCEVCSVACEVCYVLFSVCSVWCALFSMKCVVCSMHFKEYILSTYIMIWDVLHNVFPPNILNLEVSPDAIVDINDEYGANNDIICHDYVTDVAMMLVIMNMLINITMMMMMNFMKVNVSNEGEKFLDELCIIHLISVLSSMGVLDMPSSEGGRYMEGFFFLPLQEED